MTLWKLIKKISSDKSNRSLILSVMLALLQSILFVLIPGLSIWVLHILITDPQNSSVFIISLLTIVITLIRVPVMSKQLSVSYEIAFDFGEKLRNHIIEHLKRLSLGLVRKQKTGELVGLFNDDVKWIEAFIGGGLGLTISSLTIPFLLLVGIFFLNFDLGLILALGIIIGFPIILIYNRVMASSVKERTSHVADLSSRIGEHFAGMKVLRSYNAVGLKDKFFRQDLEKLISSYKSAVWKLTPLSILGLFIMEMAIIFVAYVGLTQVSEGSLPFHIVIFILFAALSLYNPLLLFFAGSGQYRLAETSAENVNKFLKLSTQKNLSKELPIISDMTLSFRDVSFSYEGNNKTLEHISFSAEQGKVTAIVGPSGAGKSTLFNLAARFWDPDCGEIAIGGKNIQSISALELPKLISIVTQDTVLINESLRRNIDLGLNHYTDEQVKVAAKMAKCMDFIEENPSGFDRQVGEDGILLSGGQKQRITIARALLQDAPIILLDEATSSVDPINSRLIHQSISALTESKTVIVIAHRLSSIMGADKIIVMDKGRIVSEANHETLLKFCDVYQKLWQDHQSSKRWTMG